MGLKYNTKSAHLSAEITVLKQSKIYVFCRLQVGSVDDFFPCKMSFTNESLAFAGNSSANWTQNGTRPTNTNSAYYEQEPLVSKVFKVWAYVVVIILSLVGNSLTIGSVYQNVNRRMRTVSNSVSNC